MAQGLCILHLMIFHKPDFIIFKKFSYSFLVILLLYIPWIPNFLLTGQRQHFMELPNIGFFFVYLYDFTGKEPLTALFYLFGLGLFITKLYKLRNNSTNFQNPGFLLISYSLFSLILITYIVSIYKPVINLQSMIAVMPFIVIAVVLGYEKYKSKIILLLSSIILISTGINLVFINKYYTKNSKENFRQISGMVNSSDSGDSNVIAVSQIADFYNYYFRQMHSNIQVINPNAYSPDEALKNSSAFYVINAPFSKEKSRQLESIDEMGFLILYPQLKDKVKDISVTHKIWVDYINQNFDIDSVYFDEKRKFDVAFRYKRRNNI